MILESYPADASRFLKQEELLKFESRIDGLVLLALDIYMKYREKVHQIIVNCKW